MTDSNPGERMPVDFVPTPVFQLVPRSSGGGVNSGVSEIVRAVKNQGLRLVFGVLCCPGS